MEDTLLVLYCLVDDFCQHFLPQWEHHLLQSGLKQRRRKSQLSTAEIMTLCIYFHQSHYPTFKHYYRDYVQRHLLSLFPQLVSYERFVTLMKSTIVPLCALLQTFRGEQAGLYFAVLIKACHIKREKQHKVFQQIAKKSKSSIGWFFGFKLHLVINDKGELMAFKLTPGNVDDRKPVSELMQHLLGKVVGDKGYISKQLTETLACQGVQLITRVKKKHEK